MQKPWETDNCEHVQSYYTVYPVPVAAALWCGVPPEEVEQLLSEATEIHRAIFRHPNIKCLEPRCRALHDAIEKGALLVSRENGNPFDGSKEQVAPDRRHVTRQNLKDWIAREFPSDKPAFLFDAIERSTHSAISADAFRALKADHDKLEKRLATFKSECKTLSDERNAIESERNSLKAIVDNMGTPGERAESTYQNIIAALLDCIAGNLPGIEKHPSFPSESKLIEAIDDHYRGYGGLSKSNLSRKFPEAKRALQSR